MNFAVHHFPGSHTGVAIATVVKEVAQSYGIPQDRILYCCTDNASNMDSCVEELSKVSPTLRIYCACHWLQLAVNDAIRESPLVEAVEHLKDYVAYVGKSSLAAEKLEGIQKTMYPHKQPRKVVKEVETRWYSRYLMCQRAVDLEPAIVSHLSDLNNSEKTLDISGLKVEHFIQLKYVTACLRPFYDATMELEGDKDSSISLVFPRLQRILKSLNPQEDLETEPATYGFKDGKHQQIKPAEKVAPEGLPQYIKDFRELLRIKLVDRWDAESKVQHLYDIYMAATFLDHRCRSLKHIQDWKHKGEENIQSMAMEMMMEEQSSEAAGGGGAVAGRVTFGKSKSVGNYGPAQLAYLQANADYGGAPIGASTDWREQSNVKLTKKMMKTKVFEELSRYMKETISFDSLDMSPMEWWESYSRSFPILSKLAARLLSIPASSASCERVFPQAGLTLSKLRTRLGKDTVANLMMIKYHHSEGKTYLTLDDWEDLCEIISLEEDAARR